jgi:hypothetical protein
MPGTACLPRTRYVICSVEGSHDQVAFSSLWWVTMTLQPITRSSLSSQNASWVTGFW